MKIGRLEYVDSVSAFEDTESLNGRKVCQTVTNPDKSVHPVQGHFPLMESWAGQILLNIRSTQEMLFLSDNVSDGYQNHNVRKLQTR